MEVTARTDNGKVMIIGAKEYREIGLDLEGNERLGAWQIKEILDLALPPQKRLEERFLAEFPLEVKTAEIEVTLKYLISAGQEFLVHRELKMVRFGN